MLRGSNILFILSIIIATKTYSTWSMEDIACSFSSFFLKIQGMQGTKFIELTRILTSRCDSLWGCCHSAGSSRHWIFRSKGLSKNQIHCQQLLADNTRFWKELWKIYSEYVVLGTPGLSFKILHVTRTRIWIAPFSLTLSEGNNNLSHITAMSQVIVRTSK